MQKEISKYTSNQAQEQKPAWQSPTVSYIDIKRTMSTPGGSLSDSLFNTPPSSKTTGV